MKKIYYLILFVAPFFSFSQWNQIGNEINHDDSSSVVSITMNASGDIIIAEFVEFDSNYSSRTNYMKSFKLIDNKWQSFGDDFNKITAHKVKGTFNKSILYSSINNDGNIVNVVTRIQKEDDFYDKQIISQMYQFNGTSWEEYGKPFIQENSYEGEVFEFYSNINLLSYVTRDYNKNIDTVHFYEFLNGQWVSRKDKLIMEIKQELGIYPSINGNTILASSWSYNDKELSVYSYKYDGEKWNMLGEPIVVTQNSNTFANAMKVKTNYNGDRFLLVSNDNNDNIYLVAYSYNNQTDKWEQFGNRIYPEQDSEISFYTVKINHQGNSIVYGSKTDNLHQVKLFEFKNSQWESVLFDYYNETENSGFDFAFSMDDNSLTTNFSNKTKVFTKSILNIKGQTFGKSFKIAPNPSFEQTIITLGDTYKIINVNVNDITGKQIKSFTHSYANQIKLETNYPAGLYYITIKSNDKIATLKLVVK